MSRDRVQLLISNDHPIRRPDHPETILLLDASTISRESLLNLLVSRLPPNIVIECVARFPEHDMPLSLVVYNIHGARIDTPDVSEQINTMRKAYGMALRIVIISDMDYETGYDSVAAIHRHSLYGYIPTSLQPDLFAAAILLAVSRTSLPLTMILNPKETAPKSALTKREIEVYRLLRRGSANKIIAFRLDISIHTVKHHVKEIMRKLRATNRTEVAAMPYGIHEELADIPDEEESQQRSKV